MSSATAFESEPAWFIHKPEQQDKDETQRLSARIDVAMQYGKTGFYT